MPGKDGVAPRDVSSLYGLVRLLHRQHKEIFAELPRRDGFVLQDPHLSTEHISPLEYVIPSLLMNVVFLLYRVTCTLESWLPQAGCFIQVMLRLLREMVKLRRVMIPAPTQLLLKPPFLLKMRKAMKELLLCCLS